LLTEVLKLDKDRLYVTVFEGDARENLPALDEEAFEEWKSESQKTGSYLATKKKDNFGNGDRPPGPW